MLAGHRREIPHGVGGGIRHIARGENVGVSQHLQVTIDVQATLRVPGCGDLLGQWTGAKPDRPDHGVRLDMLPVSERDATGIHRGDCRIEYPFDAQVFASFDDGRTNPVAHRRGDLWSAVHDNDSDVGVVTQRSTQAGRHFGGGFNAGEASAGHHHGVAGGADRPVL
ncbi:hypothetical protein D3C84_895530 [compost metagenome]